MKMMEFAEGFYFYNKETKPNTTFVEMHQSSDCISHGPKLDFENFQTQAIPS